MRDKKRCGAGPACEYIKKAGQTAIQSARKTEESVRILLQLMRAGSAARLAGRDYEFV